MMLIEKVFLKIKIWIINQYFFKKTFNLNKQQKDKWVNISTPVKMLQKLPIALAQLKAGNTFKNLLNEIRQIIYFCN